MHWVSPQLYHLHRHNKLGVKSLSGNLVSVARSPILAITDSSNLWRCSFKSVLSISSIVKGRRVDCGTTSPVFLIILEVIAELTPMARTKYWPSTNFGSGNFRFVSLYITYSYSHMLLIFVVCPLITVSVTSLPSE